MNTHNLPYKLVLIFSLLFLFACESEEPCVPPDVDIVATNTRSVRQEGSARVVANFGGTYDYKWNNGRSQSRISDLEAGEYCVTITSPNSLTCESVLCTTVESIEAVGSYDVDDGISKILFIGNSHTFYNDLPIIVGGILENSELPKPLVVKDKTGGGWRLENHAEDLKTSEMIRSDNWDYIVLQENAGYASLPKAEAENEVYPFAQELHDQISDNNPKTKIILYLTHAYEDGLNDCESIPNACTNESMQNEIRRNYLEVNNLIESTIAPAGIMWKMIGAQDIPIKFWDEDKIHASPEGSQISAATIAAIISGKKLEAKDIDNSIIGFNESQLVVDIINKALFDGEPDWRTF